MLKCKKDLLLAEIHQTDNNADKEKILIYKQYYNFIQNKSCIDFIESSINLLKLYIQNLKNDDLKTLVIIVLKSFLEKKNFYTDNEENYINSDEIFNYITEQYNFYLITNKKYLPKKNIQTLCLFALDLLANHNMINTKKIIINEQNIKTIKYYNIPNIKHKKNIDEYLLFAYDAFNLIEFDEEYYITTYHYSKTFELYKKNFNSNKGFKLKNINYIMNKINIKLYVDNEYQTKMNEVLNINEKKIYEQISENNSKINEYFKNTNWTLKTKNDISELQSKNSSYINNLIYKHFSQYQFQDNNIYFPIFIDFRGRKYYHSRIGPTSSKILRLAFYYGYYNQNDFDEKNNKYSITHYEIIEKFCNEYNIPKKKKYYETYFWLLIGIGKFYINKNKYPIKVETFLKAGIDNYNNTQINEVEQILEIFQYKNIIKQIENDKIKKKCIIKDATSSINQILMKKLGPLDQDSLNYVNLGTENEWYDTYLVCRDLYIKNNNNKTIDIKYINENLPRNLIKNPVMIIPYGAGKKLCWENYKNNIHEKNFKININNELKKFMFNFYNFIKNDMQELYLFKKSSTNLVNKISEDFESLRKYVIESETGEADISYYKMKKASIDKKYSINGVKKRVTKLILTPSTALDKKTFDIAAGANTVHFLDADEIRIIEEKLGYSIITIHDSYLIDFNNCTKLIDIKIDHYQKQIDKHSPGYIIKNIFILL